ncbi:Immunoglobulin V-set domain [Trinorchestia longiramus]|nr:Immunoglobulin V-set domain [Trinorchestia longiramus]
MGLQLGDNFYTHDFPSPIPNTDYIAFADDITQITFSPNSHNMASAHFYSPPSIPFRFTPLLRYTLCQTLSQIFPIGTDRPTATHTLSAKCFQSQHLHKNSHHLKKSTYSQQQSEGSRNQPSCLRTGWAQTIHALTRTTRSNDTRPMSAGSLLKTLEVPQFTFVSGTVTLRCVYDMGTSRLYSLKWYHNNTEFYRYVPTERNGPVNIGPTNIFMLHEVSRDSNHVTLSLSRLTVAATGTYKCEVLAEHPSFRTEAAHSFMRVLSNRLRPPLIKGVREIYEHGDLITVGCQPQKMGQNEPMPKIQWSMDGKQVSPKHLAKYGYTSDGHYTGVSLNLQGQQVVEAGGSVLVDCRLSLGEFEEYSSATIRVRMEHKFLASAPDAGSAVTALGASALLSSLLCVALCSLR